MNAALIGLIGVIVGGTISSIATIWISKSQLKMGLRNAQISFIQNQIDKLEQLLSSFANIRMEVKEDTVLPQQMFGRAMLSFSEKILVSKQCFHYLSPNLVSDLKRIHSEIGVVVFDGKTGKDPEIEYFKDLFSRIQKADIALNDDISARLSGLQIKLNSLLFDKNMS